MLVTVILGALSLLSVGLLLWQFAAAMRFPLHRRETDHSFAPDITLLKPIKGCDEHTRDCLRSWFTQMYRGKVQILFGVADEDDPVCPVIRELLKEFQSCDAELIITGESLGANAKVSNLVQIGVHAKYAMLCVSDADVRAPEDFLANAVAPLRDANVGLVNSFYRLANPSTLALRWEAIAINADFWSQVLQSNALKPQDFALGAVMITRWDDLKKIGGFASLLDYLADDYQLGHRIAANGQRIELSPVVVECWDKPATFAEAWNHQLRWARTIRVSQPLPYFLSILSNVTLWATLLALFGNPVGLPLVPDSVLYSHSISPRMQNAMAPIHMPWVLIIFLAVLATRVLVTASLQRQLTRDGALKYWWLVPAKDFLQVGIWLASFLGNTVEWRGKKFRLKRGGKLVPL